MLNKINNQLILMIGLILGCILANLKFILIISRLRMAAPSQIFVKNLKKLFKLKFCRRRLEVKSIIPINKE
jgi:hypothetical protein